MVNYHDIPYCVFLGSLSVGPSYGPMLGGLAVTISGPCFDQLSNTSNVVCKFKDIETPAEILDATRAQCILPMLLRTGRIPVALSVDGGNTYDHTGIYTLGKYISVFLCVAKCICFRLV